MSKLYKTLQSLCDERNLKFTALAKKAGISPSILYDLKSGRKQTITLPTAQKLANALGIDTSKLIGEEKEESPQESSDDEVWELRRELSERSEMKTLFDLSRNATKEDIELVNEMLKRMKGDYEDE